MAARMITKGTVMIAKTMGMMIACQRSVVSVLNVADTAGIEPRSKLVFGRFRETSSPPACTMTLEPGTSTLKDGWGKDTPWNVLGTLLMMVKPRASPSHRVSNRKLRRRNKPPLIRGWWLLETEVKERKRVVKIFSDESVSFLCT